jgi:hypothetical protein
MTSKLHYVHASKEIAQTVHALFGITPTTSDMWHIQRHVKQFPTSYLSPLSCHALTEAMHTLISHGTLKQPHEIENEHGKRNFTKAVAHAYHENLHSFRL